MSIRQRTRNLLVAAGIGVFITGVISAGIITFNHYKYLSKINEIEKAYQEKELTQKKDVLVANEDLGIGTPLKPEYFTIKKLDIAGIPNDAMSSLADIQEQIVRIPIKSNTVLSSSMFLENASITDDLRNQEFTEIQLPQKLNKNDLIDVRINFPTGQDYIVLAGKQVKDLIGGKVWFELNEDEILTMSSAIVDAYLNGGLIYSLTYVDPGYQEKAKVNYPVNEAVLDLMKMHPNLLDKAREELTRAMRNQLNKQLNASAAADDSAPSPNKTNPRLQMQDQNLYVPDSKDNQNISTTDTTEPEPFPTLKAPDSQ